MQKSYSRRGILAATTRGVFASAVARAGVANETVVEPIQRLVTGLLQVMKEGMGTAFGQRFDMLSPVIDQTFDLETILEASVGASWSTLTPDQQQMLEHAFRRYTVATYVNSFSSFDGQRFEVGPETRVIEKEQVVQTKIILRTGESHALDYVMRQGGGGWRAVDVLAEGSISRVAVQRSDFRRLLARGGAQALADSLRSKSADLT